MSLYPLSVAGESFLNSDGSSRQEEIRRCRIGEPVTLELDPNNPYDSNCIKVISARGIQIGNIARQQAEWLSEHIELGNHCSAVILDGGESESGHFGVSLLVSLDADQPPDIAKFEQSRDEEF